MIQANELRIGNFVNHFGVTVINAGMIVEFDNHPNRINPIPLTEEWLMKFGFEEYCGGWENNIRLEYVPEMSCYQFDTDGGRIIQTRPIIYIHQLQNLYFALTGKELEIKQ